MATSKIVMTPAHELHIFPAIAKNTARSIPSNRENFSRSALNVAMLCRRFARVARAQFGDRGGVFMLRGHEAFQGANVPMVYAIVERINAPHEVRQNFRAEVNDLLTESRDKIHDRRSDNIYSTVG